MSGVSSYFSNLVSDAIHGRTSFPSTVYIALCTSEPFSYSTGSTLAEPPAGVGYSRQSFNMNTSNWSQSSSGSSRNTTPVSFTTSASGEWGTVVCWAIVTASSGGNLLMWGTLDDAVTVVTGAVVSIPAGGMEYGVDQPVQQTIG